MISFDGLKEKSSMTIIFAQIFQSLYRNKSVSIGAHHPVCKDFFALSLLGLTDPYDMSMLRSYLAIVLHAVMFL